jgi:hypothetical protein
LSLSATSQAANQATKQPHSVTPTNLPTTVRANKFLSHSLVTVSFDPSKLERREAKNMSANPTGLVPVEVASECLHGIPLSSVLVKERSAAVQEYEARMVKWYREMKALELETIDQTDKLKLNDYQRACGGNHLTFLEEFWSESRHARVVDAEMERYWYAFATDALIRGNNMRRASSLAILGNYLATWFKLGKDTFIGALQGIPVKSHQSQARGQKMSTDREVVLFLSRQIPCSCLDENKKNAKQIPKTRWCQYCFKEDLKVELMKCSQCKLVGYCSKECQIEDWRRGHKSDCKQIASREE